jgi:hypothetical protein
MAPEEDLVLHDQVHDRPGRHHAAGLCEAVIRADHQILASALSRPQLAAAPLPGGEMTSSASAPGQAVGIYGRKDIHERY